MIFPPRYFPWVLAVCLLMAVPAGADVVHTLDGKTYEGTVSFDKQGFLVVSIRLGPDARVDPENLLDAVMIDKPGEGTLACGIVLIDGTSIAADQINRADDVSVTYTVKGESHSMALSKVARIVFRPVSARRWEKAAGHFGALLDNGDLFEGDFKGITGAGVVIESVLFGISNFSPAVQVQAVSLAEPQPLAANWAVELSDGSVWPAAGLKFEDGKLILDNPLGGAVQADAKMIAEIRSGANRLRPLSALKPQKIEPLDGSSYMLDSTPAAIPARLIGYASSHAIGAAAGSAITYVLDDKYRAFSARAGVPKEISPLVSVGFVVLADGKEIFRSPPRTSIDAPLVVTANLTGVKTFTLKLESNYGADMGAVGIWADPSLIKPAP